MIHAGHFFWNTNFGTINAILTQRYFVCLFCIDNYVLMYKKRRIADTFI